MSVSRFAVSALLAAAFTTSLFAQDSTSQNTWPRSHTPSEFERRSSLSISFVQSRPTGAFQKNIGFGYGGNFGYMFRLDNAGVFSLRTDGGFAVYGDEHFRAPLSSTVGGRIQVKVSTNNYIVPLSIGPQLTWPSGHVRPYLNAGLGAQFFVTESHVEGSNDDWDFASTTNHSDWTNSWVAGGGVYVPLYQNKTKVLLDIGAQYYNGGRAKYLRPGSIQDLPDAQIQITPLESETHMFLVRLGVKISL